jgi:hypothetical protein
MAKLVTFDTTNTDLVVAVHGAAMSAAEKEMANADAKLFLSSKAQRKEFITLMCAMGRTSADWDKPEAKDCEAFYKELKAFSRKACESGQSTHGLNAIELKQFPKGYSIATVIDPDVKPSQLPDWATEDNRYNGTSIRRYWQQQVDGWFKSTRKSMEDKEAKDSLISGGASALTKAKAQKTVDDLGRALKRDCDMGEGDKLVLGIAFAKSLRAQINTICKTHDSVKLPKFMQE